MMATVRSRPAPNAPSGATVVISSSTPVALHGLETAGRHCGCWGRLVCDQSILGHHPSEPFHRLPLHVGKHRRRCPA